MKSSLVTSGKVIAVYEELETEEAMQTIIARMACMISLPEDGPRAQSPGVLIERLVFSVFRLFFFLCWRLNPGFFVLGKGSAPELPIFSTVSSWPAFPRTVGFSLRSLKAEHKVIMKLTHWISPYMACSSFCS